MEIKNIVFDFGNVLYKFEHENILYNYVDSEEEMLILKDVIFSDWKSIDIGAIPYEEYVEKVVETLPKNLKATGDIMLKSWHKTLPPVEGMIELLVNLKEKGYLLYLISNAPEFLTENFEYFPESKYFTDILVSADCKMVKPDKNIYDFSVKKFGIKAEESLFIDDKIANIEGAKEFGLMTYHFDGDTKKLREFLVE